MAGEMAERRKSSRTRVTAVGQVLADDHLSPLSCDVLDLTDDGARLEVGMGGKAIGREFDFSFDKFRTIRRCRLIWRAASFVGVQFLQLRR